MVFCDGSGRGCCCGNSDYSDYDSEPDYQPLRRRPERAPRSYGYSYQYPKQNFDPFPFLRLPRELRDEVYKYFVLFDTPKPPAPTRNPQSSSIREYGRISLDLTIFRVNKQIHNEAASIFYGQNVFQIKIITNSRFQKPKTYFDVIYDTPWESMTYTCEANRIGRYRDKNTEYGGYPYDRPARKSEIEEGILPRRYQLLLRQVRIDLIDLRVTPSRRENEPSDKAVRAKVRKILWPFSERLNTTLGPAKRNLNLDINIIPALMVDKKDKIDANSEFEFWERSRPDEDCSVPESYGDRSPERDIDVDLDLYEELIETAWPLTRGPWRYRFILPPPFFRKFKGLLETKLRRCNGSLWFMEKERSRYKNMKALKTCCWVIDKGRLVLLLGDV